MGHAPVGPAVVPPALEVGEPTLRVTADRISGELAVANPTAAAVELVAIPYGGRPPYGGESPFAIAIGQEAGTVVTHVGEVYPPEPPAPIAITFPARSAVVFAADLPLADWAWQGAPQIPVRWSFYGPVDAIRDGTALVKLPAR